jgi:hypothetical protein
MPVKKRNRMIAIAEIGMVSSKVLLSLKAAKKLNADITATNNTTANNFYSLF